MNATATTPARQCKPQTKPARSVRLIFRSEGTSTGVVRLTVGKDAADYFINAVAADFGRGFKVEKIGLHATEPGYAVNIDGAKRSCECKGYLKWGRCKHADGLAALIAAGKL